MAISKIKTDSIADAAITSDKIATGGISTADLADGAITSDKIANDAISTAALVNGAVTDTKLATGSVENYFGTQGFALGMRNRIINGDMRIDQRNAGASVTPINGQYTLDRWRGLVGATSKFTLQQNQGSVVPPSGFTNYLGVTSSSAYTVGADERFTIQQYIEGFNIADLGWGTASASTVTLSLWVRSSLTGTFGGSLQNSDGTRSYPFTYSITSSNTWEFKTITIEGDTAGTWLTNNGRGILLNLAFGVGSTFSGTAGAWSGSNFASSTGAVSVVGTNGATFYITGVQLEAGSVATPFERRPYGTEFDLCRRYCEVYSATQITEGGIPQGLASVDASNRPESMLLYYPKRAAPTVTVSSGTVFNWAPMTGGSFIACTGFDGTLVGTTVNSANLFFSTASGVTVNTLSAVGYFIFNNAGTITVSAEL
jgi:hypothetical protein